MCNELFTLKTCYHFIIGHGSLLVPHKTCDENERRGKLNCYVVGRLDSTKPFDLIAIASPTYVR